ncbi:MAG TPA: hypothetical protein VHN12_02535 [Geobacteraceae bacterium]|nr:hypothetical protein [Geobacteraceae bacterium]
MKARLITLIAALFLPLILILCSSTTAQNQSSCVTCHTDEAALKKTCKPFVIPEGEGEG